MNRDCKKVLARIARLCRDNIAAFGPTYDPRWPSIPGPGPQMKGAKSEGNGVTDMAREILAEIRLIRREHRRSNAPREGSAVARTLHADVGATIQQEDRR